MQPAIALLEFSSIAAGIEAGDAMVKRAPLDATYAGTIQPGRYLVLVGGDTASVEEAIAAGTAVAEAWLIDLVFLADVHPDVVAAISGRKLAGRGEALGVIETQTVAAAIEAADAGIKGAQVELGELRLGDGLGGKGYVLFYGAVSDVEAAVSVGSGRIEGTGQLVERRVIAQLHPEMQENLAEDALFAQRVQGAET